MKNRMMKNDEGIKKKNKFLHNDKRSKYLEIKSKKVKNEQKPKNIVVPYNNYYWGSNNKWMYRQ